MNRQSAAGHGTPEPRIQNADGISRPYRPCAILLARIPRYDRTTLRTPPVPVLIWIARAVLAASALLAVVFDPRLFFGKVGGSGNWISFGSWFYDGSWWAFRLICQSFIKVFLIVFNQSSRFAVIFVLDIYKRSRIRRRIL